MPVSLGSCSILPVLAGSTLLVTTPALHAQAPLDGFLLEAPGEDASFGFLASNLGDVNGDGLDDYALAAQGTDEGFVLFGRPGEYPDAISTMALRPEAGGDGSDGFVIRSVASEGALGFDIGAAGDVNGDGLMDVIIADIAEGIGGEAYVIYGRATPFPPAVDVSDITPPNGDGSLGFAIAGVGADNNIFAASGAGDVNGDGFDDLVLGAPGNLAAIAGQGFLVFGGASPFPPRITLSDLLPENGGDGSVGVVLQGGPELSVLGELVRGVGDINNDGIDDVGIGASTAGPGGTGQVYLLLGSDQGFDPVIDLIDLLPAFGGDGSRGTVFLGGEGFALLGFPFGAAGDVNGDGVDDLFLGAIGVGSGYLVFGTATPFPAVFPVTELLPENGGDGSQGVAFAGSVADNSGFGAGAGDVNGDGFDDLLIGAPGADEFGRNAVGETFLVYGRSQFPARFELSALEPTAGGDGSEGTVFDGIDAFDDSGFGVAGIGDINDDGFGDFYIGAPGALRDDLSPGGEAVVLFGRATPFAAREQLGTLLPLSASLRGDCPGAVTAQIEGATPLGPVLLFSGTAEGADPVPFGPCAGTPTGLANPNFRQFVRTQLNGKGEIDGQIGLGSCGAPTQVLDLISCELSPVVDFPQ